MRKSLIATIILVIMLLLIVISSGCSRYSELSITSQDFKMVNEYIKEMGSQEISLKDAISMDQMSLYEHKETKEKKRMFELIVDYVLNEESDESSQLDYEFEFSNSSIQFQSDLWEHIGG